MMIHRISGRLCNAGWNETNPSLRRSSVPARFSTGATKFTAFLRSRTAIVLIAAGVTTAGSANGWAQTTGTVSYSNSGTGLLSGNTQGISAEWLGFTSTDLTLGGPGTSYSFTLASGYHLTFTATLTGNDTATNSTVPTTSAALFGNTAYTGITGDVAI